MGSHGPQNYSDLEGTGVQSVAYNTICNKTEQVSATEQVKEFIMKSGSKDTETLVLRSEDKHLYLGIFIEE